MHKESKAHMSAKKVAIVMTVLAVIGFGAAGYMYTKVQNTNKNTQAENAKKIEDLRTEVGKIMTLPNETPTVFEVTDTSKLKDQPFFKDAKVGDRMLMFAQARKAIIYRPSDKKIVNSGPIAITSDKQPTTGTTPAKQ